MSDRSFHPNEPVIRVGRLSDSDHEDRRDWADTTVTERLEAMWQLTMDAWAFREDFDAEQGFQRHVVSTGNRES